MTTYNSVKVTYLSQYTASRVRRNESNIHRPENLKFLKVFSMFSEESSHYNSHMNRNHNASLPTTLSTPLYDTSIFVHINAVVSL